MLASLNDPSHNSIGDTNNTICPNSANDDKSDDFRLIKGRNLSFRVNLVTEVDEETSHNYLSDHVCMCGAVISERVCDS